MKKAGCLGLIGLALLFNSCSLNQLVINKVSDVLTGSGSADVFTSDSDPELVGAALPFAIKMYETLLSQNPNHQGLLLTTGSLFIMYANAFVQGPAEMLDRRAFFEERKNALERAKQLYLRGYGILSTALELKFPGFNQASYHDGTLAPFLSRFKKADVPLLYWTAAGGFAAFSLDIFDFELGDKIADWGAMMARAYELDPDFNNGAIDDFYILYYASLPELLGGDPEKAIVHFNRAVEKSGGLAAGPYVSYAQAISVPAGDFETFKGKLETALAIDPNADPSNRLLNVIFQRRARYLLSTAAYHFPDWDFDNDFFDDDFIYIDFFD